MSIDPAKYVKRSRIRTRLEHLLIGFLGKLGLRYRLHGRLYPLEWTFEEVAFPGLPDAFQGFRIIQLSDFHHGPYTLVEDLVRLVDLTNSKDPDLIVLTGDFVLNSPRYIQDGIEPLRALRARQGVFAVLGNHDHREGAREIEAALQAVGIQVLSNRNVMLERNGERLYLAGIDDLEDGDADLDRAFEGIPREAPSILLSHNPDIVELMDGHRPGLVLSGHTHGGQIVLPLIGPPFLPNYYKKYCSGLVEGPTTRVFITRGVGATLLPIRFNCPPEAVELVLKRESFSN